jgi:hypothetical protein
MKRRITLSCPRCPALVLLPLALALATGCASGPDEEPRPAVEAAAPVTAHALAASLQLTVKRSSTAGAVYLVSRGEDRIALFPGTHTTTVRGVRYSTQDPVAARGTEIWVSDRDARVLRSMWQKGVQVGPSRSAAGSFRGTSFRGIGSSGSDERLSIEDLGPPPTRVTKPDTPRSTTPATGALSPAERRDWGVPLRRPWQYIVVHHSATPAGNAAAFHVAHRERGWDGLGYHFVIGNGRKSPDGRIEVGFRWGQQREGAHAGNDLMNDRGIGICLVGDFNQSAPTAAQMRALRRLCDYLSAYCEIAPQNLRLHRDFRKTACPGRHFPRSFALRPLADIRSAAAAGHGHDPASTPR